MSILNNGMTDSHDVYVKSDQYIRKENHESDYSLSYVYFKSRYDRVIQNI